MVNRRDLTKKYFEELGIIDVDYESMTFKRWSPKYHTYIVVSPTQSLQLNKKGKVRYINYIFGLHRHTYSYSNLVYTWFVGKIPAGMLIDHINGDTSDNRPENLRLSTSKLNAKNNYKI